MEVCSCSGCVDVFTGASPVRRPDPGGLDRKTGKCCQAGTTLMVVNRLHYAALHHLFNPSETHLLCFRFHEHLWPNRMFLQDLG